MNRAFSKKPASKPAASSAWGDDEAEPVVITSQQVWNKALSLQGRREHSRVELTQKLKLSPIVGYLLAGGLIGPYTPGFTGDLHIAQQLV